MVQAWKNLQAIMNSDGMNKLHLKFYCDQNNIKLPGVDKIEDLVEITES